MAEPQAAGGGQKKGDKTPGGGGAANLKGDRSRLLRDLRVDTKSRAAWARLLQEHPNARKYKGGNKKGLSKGCFGLKLDRIDLCNVTLYQSKYRLFKPGLIKYHFAW